jgi:hypothetical protein
MIAFSLAAQTRTCYSFFKILLASSVRLAVVKRSTSRRWSAMMRLLIAVVAGLAIGVVGVVLAASVLSSAANGTPSNASLYVYGNR